jgi:hypothetical protein
MNGVEFLFDGVYGERSLHDRVTSLQLTTTPPVAETPPTGIESFQAVSAASVCVYGYVNATSVAGPDSVLCPMKLVVSLCYTVRHIPHLL